MTVYLTYLPVRIRQDLALREGAQAAAEKAQAVEKAHTHELWQLQTRYEQALLQARQEHATMLQQAQAEKEQSHREQQQAILALSRQHEVNKTH